MPDIAYLASPYSDKSTAVQYDRYSMAVSAVAALVRNGCFVFSPIVHSHPVAMLSDMPGDYAYWQDFDEAMLRRCDRMIVLKLQGWRTSLGVQAEIEVAMRLGMNIEYMEVANADSA